MVLEWSSNLETGHGEIDDQHRELFRRFDALLDACSQGKGNDEVMTMLGFLGDYVRTHFALEEKLLLQHGFPGYAAHKEQHDGLIRDLEKLVSDMNADGATTALVIQTNKTLVDWLVQHISVTDRELGNFLRTVAPSP